MRSPGRRVALTVACACWIACAQRTAWTTLRNSPKTESPAVSTTHPSCASTRDWVRVWKSRISAVVPSSSRPIIRLKPETSTIRIAESLRRGVEASVAIRVPHESAGLLGVPGTPLVPADTGESPRQWGCHTHGYLHALIHISNAPPAPYLPITYA